MLLVCRKVSVLNVRGFLKGSLQNCFAVLKKKVLKPLLREMIALQLQPHTPEAPEARVTQCNLLCCKSTGVYFIL